MLKFFKYCALAFFVQAIFLAGVLWVVSTYGEKAIGEGFLVAIFFFYIWPLLMFPVKGGSHGGELFLAPFTMAFHSLLFAAVIVLWKKYIKK